MNQKIIIMRVVLIMLLFQVCFGNLCLVHHNICSGHWNIPREMMPQFEGPLAQQYLDSNSYCGVVDISHLTMTQNELHPSKVWSLVNSGSCNVNPIVIAENKVIDGHHRFAACKLTGKTHLNAYIIDKPAGQVLNESVFLIPK